MNDVDVALWWCRVTTDEAVAQRACSLYAVGHEAARFFLGMALDSGVIATRTACARMALVSCVRGRVGSRAFLKESAAPVFGSALFAEARRGHP